MIRFTAEEIPMMNDLVTGKKTPDALIAGIQECIDNTDDSTLKSMAVTILEKVKSIDLKMVEQILVEQAVRQEVQY